MMNTCGGRYPSKNGKPEHNHEEIVHDGKECPLCEALDELDVLREEVAILRQENNRMDNQLAMCTDACEVCPNRFECVTTKDNK